MTAKKTTVKNTEIDEPQVVENDVDSQDLPETSPAEREVTETGPMTFTVEINGEEIELVDHYRKDKAPAEFLLVSRENMAEKYLPGLLEKLIGEEQMFDLLEKDMSLDELSEVPRAWAKGRGLGKR